MAHLNENERSALAEKLAGMAFKKAQAKIRGMDRSARLVYFRNQQSPTHVWTRYLLPNQGAVVTLIEKHARSEQDTKRKVQYELTEVVVESITVTNNE